MSAEVVECSGYLTFPPLSPEQMDAVRRASTAAGLEVDVADEWLELECAGRDAQQKTVALLRQVAPIIGDAQGEITCERYADDERNELPTPVFVYYSLRGGKLFQQKGQVVREPIEEADERDGVARPAQLRSRTAAYDQT